MEATAKSEGNEGGVSAGQANACPKKSETREQKLLSLRYVGQMSDGRYVFRTPQTPSGPLVAMNADEYREWQLAQNRYGLIDAELLQSKALMDRYQIYSELVFPDRQKFDARKFVDEVILA